MKTVCKEQKGQTEMKNSTIITEIDGQGQKIAAVVLEFGESIKDIPAAASGGKMGRRAV